MPSYTVTYHFNPNDPMWVLDNNSVKKATCLQVDIKVVPTTLSASQTLIYYIALLDCNAGTITVKDENAYPSLELAIAALQNNIETSTC